MASPEIAGQLSAKIIGGRNERGIPSVLFLEAVDTFMTSVGIESIDPLIGAMQQLYSKYKFMETNLQKTRESFQSKIAETKKNLEILQHFLEKQKSSEKMHTKFNLADNVYAQACVDPNIGKVCIWLGANVMVEYPYDEALTLLNGNVDAAAERLRQIEDDLRFIREQVITTEVNMARIFNFEVLTRRKEVK